MTMGQMCPGPTRWVRREGPWNREQVISKASALLGGDLKMGTPFTSVGSLRSVCSQLHASRYPAMGREVMYSGITGERLDGAVYIGLVYYQRLRHMVQIPSPQPPHTGCATGSLR